MGRAFLVRFPGSVCADCGRTVSVGETAFVIGHRQYCCFECGRKRDTGAPARIPRGRVASGRRDLDD